MSKRLKLEDVKKEYENNGCKLLETTYKGNRVKMKFECSCGNIYHKSYDNFRTSPRCRLCGNKSIAEDHRYDHNTVKQFFANNECELLDEYKDSRSPMNYKCKCGTISKISFDNFKHGKRCKNCKRIKLRGDNHWNWNSDRQLIKERKDIRKKCYKALRSTLQKIGTIKENKTYVLLGYTPEDLHKHLSSFKNWNKLKKGQWHLDHIFPIKAFLDFEIYDIKLINSLHNLQPLSKNENLSKTITYDVDEFKKWLHSYS